MFRGPADIWSFSPALFGPVRANVDRVSLRLSDGVVLILRPVAAFGHRWIGVVLPPGLAPVKAVAYSRTSELAHSVPFKFDLGVWEYDFLTWLPAGDNGPSRATKVVRGGGLALVLRTGPWGNCLIGGGWRAGRSRLTTIRMARSREATGCHGQCRWHSRGRPGT